MLPGVYGFRWDAGHLIFLGMFYTVLAVIVATIAFALYRAVKALRERRAERIRWASDFHDLTKDERTCRHVFTGEYKERVCDRAFDCRECSTHARLAAAKTTPAREQEEAIYGLSFPLDRAYHRGHTWVKRADDGTLTIGLDDLGARLTGAPDEIELPAAGTQVAVNGTGWRVQRNGISVRILSPVDGEVIETGGPSQGWYLKVRPSADWKDTHLLRGSEVRQWVMRELERLQFAFGSARTLSPTLADGGEPLADMPKASPRADWDAIWGTMFLEP